jgi:chemotaxis protein histidine kinase CheA
MNPRLPILGLLIWLLTWLPILSIPVFCRAQSLGDVARETRVEEQKAEQKIGVPPKVITNEDVAPPAQTQASESSEASETSETSASPSAAAAAPDGQPAGQPRETNAAASGAETKEREVQQRTDEINRRYLDRIAALRDEIGSAQTELTRLQGDYENRWTIPERYPPGDIHFRELQALASNNQVSELIEAQRKRIASLNARLEDVKEEARHAGVPHATD